MTPSWPAVYCSFTTIHKLIGAICHQDTETFQRLAHYGHLQHPLGKAPIVSATGNTLEPQIGDPLIIFTFLLENTHLNIEYNGFMPFSGPMYNISLAKKILQIFQYATD